MAVRLHRVRAGGAAPRRAETPGPVGAIAEPATRTSAVSGELRLAAATFTPPRPSFPPPPTVKLAPPKPIDLRSHLLRTTGLVLAAGLGGAALVWGSLTMLHRAAPIALSATVLDSHRDLASPGSGRFHAVVAPGASVEAGATLALLLPMETPKPTPIPDAKRLEESLHRAETALTDARTHLTSVEHLYFEERATRSEKDDAARDVRFRQGERDRLARALAAATSATPASTPAGTPILADAAMTILSFTRTDGARVTTGDPVASVRPRASIAEAALGKTRAPEEGTPVRVRVGDAWTPGVISGIHVDGDTRTVRITFDASAEPGSSVEIAAAK